MTFLYTQFVKNKVKISNIEACMLIVNSRKTSLQIKKKFRVSFSPANFLLFSFQGRFFPKHASRGNRQKGLVRNKAVDHEPTVMLYIATQQWEAKGQPEVSKFGMMLQRHIFKTITGAGLSDVCLRECYTDVRCQSFNYVFTQDICELSNRTKEARPEDYVPNPERFYFKRDYKRGLYIFCLLPFKDIFRAKNFNPNF